MLTSSNASSNDNVLFANNLKEARAVQTSVSSGVVGGVAALASGSGGGSSLIIGATAALIGAIVVFSQVKMV